MPQGHIPDPNSQQALAQQLAQLQTQIDEMKLRQGIQPTALGYAQTSANQLGISTEVDITGLSKRVVVGTNRLIRVTGFVRTFKHTGATEELWVHDDSTPKNYYGLCSLTKDDGQYATLIVISIIVAPVPGSHTYSLSIDANPVGTVDVIAAQSTPNWLLIEDVGAAPL